MEWLLGSLWETVVRQKESGERQNFRLTMKSTRIDSMTTTKKWNRPDNLSSLKSLMKISSALLHRWSTYFSTIYNPTRDAVFWKNVSNSLHSSITKWLPSDRTLVPPDPELNLQSSRTNNTGVMSHFHPLDLKKIDNIVGQLRSSTCCLDPLHTTF